MALLHAWFRCRCGEKRIVRCQQKTKGGVPRPTTTGCILTPGCPGPCNEFVEWA